MISRTHTNGILIEGDIEFGPSGRVTGEYHVKVKGLVHYVGTFDRALTVFNTVTVRNLSGRAHQDNMLRRLFQ